MITIRFLQFFLFINFISINNAYAYLDPGSISIVVQFLAALLSSTIIFFSKINRLISEILSKKKTSTFIILNLTLFPIWVFKSSFSTSLTVYTLIFIYIIPFLIFFIIFWKIDNYKNIGNFNLSQIIILSLLITYSLDQNIGLWTIANYSPFHGKSLYIFSVCLLVIIFLIVYFLIKKSNFRYLFVIMIFIFSYNIFSLDKNLNNLDSKISFDNYDNEKLSLNKYKKKNHPSLFIILDEMNGIGGLDKNIDNTEKAKSSFINLAKNFQFKVYPYSYTTVPGTLSSIPRMLNFDNTYNLPYYNDYLEDHGEYFFGKIN